MEHVLLGEAASLPSPAAPSTVVGVTDPEDVTQLQKADLTEVEVDETPDDERPVPFEADPADVSDQRIEVPVDEEPDDLDPDY
jgi:hypothetical protein